MSNEQVTFTILYSTVQLGLGHNKWVLVFPVARHSAVLNPISFALDLFDTPLIHLNLYGH